MNLEYRMMRGQPDWGIQSGIDGLTKFVTTTGIIAIDLDTDKLAGACMMDKWTETTVHAHLTLVDSEAALHGFPEYVSNYLFNEMKRQRVYGMVPADNEKALQITSYIGFEVKAVLEEAYAVGVDYLLLELTRANCRFIDTEIDEKVA